MNKELAVVLISGGMDSCVTAAIANEEYELAFLHINYGQRTEKRELKSFNEIAEFYKVGHRLIVHMSHFSIIGGSSLTDEKLKVLHGGIMWRPLVDVIDVARSHIICIKSHQPENEYFKIYNIVQDNYRILDLAHLIKHELKQERITPEVDVFYTDEPQRSYRISERP